MSPFTVNVVARNPKNEDLATPPIAALVDTGSELTWLPADLLRQAGITPRRRRAFSTATKELVTRDVGYAIVSAEEYETTDEVVFAEPGDATLLGVRTLEGFGVVVDNIGHRFITQTTIVASWMGGPDMAPHTPQRSARLGEAVARLCCPTSSLEPERHVTARLTTAACRRAPVR